MGTELRVHRFQEPVQRTRCQEVPLEDVEQFALDLHLRKQRLVGANGVPRLSGRRRRSGRFAPLASCIPRVPARTRNSLCAIMLEQLTATHHVGILSNMKAAELVHTRIICSGSAFAELRLWRVPEPVAGSRHGYKYRLV